MRHKLLIALVTIALLTTGLAANVAYAQPPGSTVVKVTEADIVRQAENTTPTNNWVLYTRTVDSEGVIDVGPGNPPIGAASLQLTTPTGSDKVVLFNYDYIDTSLSAISAMSYATYRTSGAIANQVPALNIQVDFNGPATGGFTTLVFEPVYNTDQGAIVDGTWQVWDAINAGAGVWWSTQPINNQCAGASVGCWKSWDYIVANNPDATILGGFGINQGSGNPALISAVDALTIGLDGVTTTYDFDLPTSGEMIDDLQDATAELVENRNAERALLASLNRAERYMEIRPQFARVALLQYILQVRLYDAFGLIDGDAADQLVAQAQELMSSLD